MAGAGPPSPRTGPASPGAGCDERETDHVSATDELTKTAAQAACGRALTPLQQVRQGNRGSTTDEHESNTNQSSHLADRRHGHASACRHACPRALGRDLCALHRPLVGRRGLHRQRDDLLAPAYGERERIALSNPVPVKASRGTGRALRSASQGLLSHLSNTSPSALLCICSSPPFLGGIRRNSSQSPRTRFMCLSKAMNLQATAGEEDPSQ